MSTVINKPIDIGPQVYKIVDEALYGDLVSQTRLGVCYQFGIGVEKNSYTEWLPRP